MDRHSDAEAVVMNAYCPVCARALYVEGDIDGCPVCSSSLLSVAESDTEEPDRRQEEARQP